MRQLCVFLALVGAASPTAIGQPSKTIRVRHDSNLQNPPVPLAEVPKGACWFRLTRDLKDKGNLAMTLDSSRPKYDETGEIRGRESAKTVDLFFTVRLVKTVTVMEGGKAQKRPLYRLEPKGAKTSKCFVLGPATERGTPRLLIHDDKGKVAYVVELPHEEAIPGCHPGCFPAGTPVMTPKGTRLVDAVRIGDEVMTVSADGKNGIGMVRAVFVSTNLLLAVETDAGTLVTTGSQPLCLADGRVLAAERVRVGDSLYRWADDARVATKVKAVRPTDRVEKVFNLVIGEGVIFVAGGFLARGKPPAD